MKLVTLKWNKQNKKWLDGQEDQGKCNIICKTERLSDKKEMSTTRNYPGSVGWED